MANQFFDSELTAEQIEKALNTIHGLIAPTNNGKILCVKDGKLVAKSASELQPNPLPNFEEQYF